jgi:hypothetical protein
MGLFYIRVNVKALTTGGSSRPCACKVIGQANMMRHITVHGNHTTCCCKESHIGENVIPNSRLEPCKSLKEHVL